MESENNSVKFINNNIIYDFKELNFICDINDVSTNINSLLDFMELDFSNNITIDPEFSLFNYIDVSFITDSKAILYVPKDYFHNLFKINIKHYELLNDNFDNIKFAIDTNNWTNKILPFHNSFVLLQYAINPKSKIDKQNIQNDFIRSIYKDITGSLKFSKLFNNTGNLLNNMELLDISLNNSIVSILNSIGGSFQNPMTINDISNNPVRDLLAGILNSPNKIYRQNVLIDNLSSQINNIWNNNLLNKFYIFGTSFKGNGHYFPVYISKYHPDLYIGFKEIKFIEYHDKVFYINPLSLNNDINDNNYPSYVINYEDEINNKFINLPFIYGDGIISKITYNPKNFSFYNQTINARSYEVTMIMSLESIININFTDLSFISQSEVSYFMSNLNYSNINITNSYIDFSGNINYNFELLWLGSEDKQNKLYSHVQYYPYIYDISYIDLETYNNYDFNNVQLAFKITCRPKINNICDEIILYNDNIVFNNWNSININQFKVLLNNQTVIDNFELFKNIDVNQISRYNTYITKHKEQQILKIELICFNTYNNNYLFFNGKLKNFNVIMNDDRHIKMII